MEQGLHGFSRAILSRRRSPWAKVALKHMRLILWRFPFGISTFFFSGCTLVCCIRRRGHRPPQSHRHRAFLSERLMLHHSHHNKRMSACFDENPIPIRSDRPREASCISPERSQIIGSLLRLARTSYSILANIFRWQCAYVLGIDVCETAARFGDMLVKGQPKHTFVIGFDFCDRF